jgi:Family of unknown function (DUF6152)
MKRSPSSRLAIGAAVLATLALALAPALALAHHSFAMFDYSKTVTLNGVIKSFEWTNPHAVMFVVASPDASPADTWSVELGSPGNLKRDGWTRDEVKPGDKVALVIHPLRDGGHGGSFAQVTLVDSGKVLKTGPVQGAPRP